MFHMIQSITSRKSFCLMIKHLAVNHSLRLDTNYDSDSYDESFDFPCSIVDTFALTQFHFLR